MNHRILMIDDNHSFVDTLQVTLKGLPLDFDSVFSYFDGEKALVENGPRINQKECAKVLNLAQKIELQDKQKNDKAFVDKPVDLFPPLFLPQGFSLILVEQDTEPGRKGLDFIQNILRQMPNFSANLFWLLTSKPTLVEEKAKALGIAVFEKPVKNQQIRSLIQAHIQRLEEQEAKVQQILEKYPQNFIIHQPKLKTKRSKKVVATGKISRKSTKNK